MIAPHPRLLALLTLLPVALAQSPTIHAVHQPAADPVVATLPGGVLLSMPGVFTDFTLAGGGQFVELSNGTAHLTGRVFSDSSIYSAFLIDITFSGKVQPIDPGYPPAAGPDLQLQPFAYVPTGTVDPGQFTYYSTATGTLTGVRNFDGAVVAVSLGGQPAQVGFGANNRNLGYGIEATFTATVLQQPNFGTLGTVSTATIVADLPTSYTQPTTHPQVDTTRSNLPYGRSMVLPGVADDYVFVPAGQFSEYDDGHAVLTGTLARIGQLDDAWDVALSLTNRIDPGQTGYPPVGSPVLQMLPSAYVANGGTMDPSHWHYYQTVTGSLTGEGLNAGGSISLSNSVATQVGGAANQTNTYFGYYGAFAPTIVTQPTARTISLTGDVELIGLTAIFPVLPFPVLNTPAVPYALDSLTDQGLVLEGDNLAWIEYVGVDWDLIGGHSASQWFSGWFRVIDNQHLEFHPRPGVAPGSYLLSVFNPAIRSNQLTLQLTAPGSPKLYSEANVPAWSVQHILVHSGPVTGAALSAIAISDFAVPTVYPGIANLGIGNGGANLMVLPGTFPHDPQTGIARVDMLVPAGWATLLHYQAVTLDLGGVQLPLPATNVWSVTYQ